MHTSTMCCFQPQHDADCHPVLTVPCTALQQVPLDEKEEYGHFAYAWHQVLLPPADVDRVLASINPAGLPWRATRSPGQPLPSRSEVGLLQCSCGACWLLAAWFVVCMMHTTCSWRWLIDAAVQPLVAEMHHISMLAMRMLMPNQAHACCDDQTPGHATLFQQLVLPAMHWFLPYSPSLSWRLSCQIWATAPTRARAAAVHHVWAALPAAQSTWCS